MTDEVMDDSLQEFSDSVVGRRIVSAAREKFSLHITLDNGKKVTLREAGDCCAYTEVDDFFLDPNSIEHVITSVTQEGDHSKWFVLAELNKVMGIDVGWSEGSGYYSYGFDIHVTN